MSGLAALAVKHAAATSVLGTTFLPGVAPGAVQGFAVGTLLCGVCYVAVMAPRRRSRRKRQPARTAGRHAAPPSGAGTRLVSRRAAR